MPIPYRRRDMKKIVEHVKQHMETVSEEDCAARIAESHAKCEIEYKQWLSYYDNDGHLKPGAERDPGYFPDRSYAFLAMSHDERATFIIAEKKRMGLL